MNGTGILAKTQANLYHEVGDFCAKLLCQIFCREPVADCPKPLGIGGTLQLTYYNESHPYHIPEDAFDSLHHSMNLIQNIWSMHNCESILAHYTSLRTES